MRSNKNRNSHRKWLTLLVLAFLSISSRGQDPGSFPTREQRFKEVGYIIKQIDSVYIYGRRGISDQEWEERTKLLYQKVENAENWNEYYYALRYVGLLIEDAHFNYPDAGNYNRSQIFQKTDTIFPIRVKAWTDGTAYVKRDYSGTIPENARIVSVNGHSARELVHLNRSLLAGEERGRRHRNGGPDPRHWTNFTNFLFMEGITAPYRVEYTAPGSERIETVTLPGMARETAVKAFTKTGDDKERVWNLLFGEKVVSYEKVGQNTAVLTIDSFWGGNLFGALIFKKDRKYGRQLRRAMARVHRDKIDTLIIDVSENPGGMIDNMYKTLDYFTEKSVDANTVYLVNDGNRDKIQAVISKLPYKLLGLGKDQLQELMDAVDGVESGSYFATDDGPFDLKFTPRAELKHRYRGTAYLLTSVHTYSAGQLFAQRFKELEIGLIAGQPCGGYSSISGGNAQMIAMPYATRLTMRVPYSGLRNDVREPRFDYETVNIPIEEISFEEWLADGENDNRAKFLRLLRGGIFSQGYSSLKSNY